MAEAKTTELREMDEDELEGRLADARQELFNLRFQHVTGQLDNYARLRQVRRDIARIQTILRENEIAAADQAEAAAQAEWEAAAAARRARVQASRRGVVAGVGAEASRAQDVNGESDDG
jgi:large subunit ribosomal protein L29